jgi:vancomycin resistance protein YoaR
MAKKKKNKAAKSRAGKKLKKQQKKLQQKNNSVAASENRAVIATEQVKPKAETTFSKKLEEVISQNEEQTKKGLFGGKVIILGPPGDYFKKDWKNIWKRFTRGMVKFLIAFVILLAIAAGIIVAEAISNDRIYPRIVLSSQDYGFMPAAEARDLLVKNLDQFQQSKLTFQYGDKPVELSLQDLGITLIPEQTLKQLPSFQFRKNSLVELLMASLQEKNITPVYKLDDQKIFKLLQDKLGLTELRAQPAAFYLDDKKNLQIRPEKEGLIIDQAKLSSALRDRVLGLDNSPVVISPLRELPAVTAKDLEKEKDDLQVRLENEIIIKYQKNNWKFKPINHLDQISFRRQNDQTIIVVLPGLLDGFFNKEIFSKVEKPVSNLKIFYNDQSEIVFDGKALDGEEVDRKKFVTDLEMALNSLDQQVELLVVKKKASLVIDPKLQEQGIKELLGTGHTAFAGSPTNRRHNIINGMSKFNGVIIKPGETFSFNRQLGEVDGSTGYKLELVIKAEGTVPEYGGGVCQVSSTVFKAALFTGLPIVERAPHSYAVSYYAQVDGYGLDSTIYPGVRDLQFTNNTPSAILIQSVVDGDDAYVNFFGTSDGRKVRLENYWRGNFRGAGGTELIPTKTLPPGARKQIEAAHGGFDASWDRVITKDGKDTVEKIYSVYRATSNRILVGEGSAQPQ